jgi:F-type H+-transporting ATPase subunit gamma
VEYAVNTLKALPGTITEVWPLGERIHALLTDTGQPTAGILPVPGSVDAIPGLIGQILIDVEATRERGEVMEVYLFHNHPKSGSVYEPIGKRLLPLDLAWQKQLVAAPWPTKLPPEVIQGTTSPLRAFIREYLFVLLFQACAESLASENASRLAAMQRAEKNIDGILEDLNLKLHRIRQESIDEELFDVISGYEALNAVRRPH